MGFIGIVWRVVKENILKSLQINENSVVQWRVNRDFEKQLPDLFKGWMNAG